MGEYESLSSAASSRIAPKIIAVGAEWAANTVLPYAGAAIAASQPVVGTLILSVYAAYLAVKNWSQGVSAAEAQAPIERRLSELLTGHKTLRKAIDAIATDQHMHELVSRERLAELQRLMQLPAAEIVSQIAEHQEVTFHLARFVQDWSDANGAQLDRIESQLDEMLPRIERKITEGFARSDVNDAKTHETLARIEKAIESLPLPPDARVPEPSWAVQTVAGFSFSDQPDVSLLALLQQRLRVASGPLLNWQATVGSGHHRLPPDLQERIQRDIANKSSLVGLLLGSKGTGKSALSAVIGNWALGEGFVVIAIKADMIPASADSDVGLQKYLNLPLQLQDAIRLLARHFKVALIVDQLDSISELTDRRSNRLNLFLNILRDVGELPNVYVLASCRDFDFRHDARLNTLSAEQYQLELPAWEAVEPILHAEGHDPGRMSETMRELLRIPWNLNMFLRAAKPGEMFDSMQALIERVWLTYVTNPNGVEGRIELTEIIAHRMSEEEELSVPLSLADDFAPARDALLHEEILVQQSEGRAIAFRHQTYYDYTLARLFAKGTKSLSEHVLSRQDGLFVRPVMLNGLEYLRDTSRKEYHRQVQAILDGNPRRHVRTLLLEFLGQRKDPDDFEVQLVLPLFRGVDGALLLRASTGSSGWFDRLQTSGDLAAWMQRDPDQAAMAMNLLLDASSFNSIALLDLIRRYWLPNKKYDRFIGTLAHYLPKWNADWAELVCVAVKRSDISITWTAEHVAEVEPRIAAQLIKALLEREFARAKEAKAQQKLKGEDDASMSYWRDDPFGSMIATDSHEHYGFDKIAKFAPREFLEETWPIFIDALRNSAERTVTRRESYRDDSATWFAYDVRPAPWLQALHVAANEWASNDPSTFLEFAHKEASTELLAAHRILSQAVAIAAKHNPVAALEYITVDPRRLMIGTHRNIHEFSIKLIAALVPLLDADQRRILEENIIRLNTYKPEFYNSMTPADRFKMQKWNREHRLRLLRAFPENLLSDAAKNLKGQEETLLPNTRDWDSELGPGGWVGPRVTDKEMGKASEDAIFNLIDELAAVENAGGHPRHPDVGRSGGLGEQASAFAAVAREQPEKVLKMLNRFTSERPEHVAFVGAAVSGLAKSPLISDELYLLIGKLETLGYVSDDFREHCASAIEERAKREELPPDDLLDLMELWLSQMTTPEWPSKYDTENGEHLRSSIIFRGAGTIFTLLHGRASVFRAIAVACQVKRPVEIPRLLRILQRRAEHEVHPAVCAELLMYSHNAFTVREAIPNATAAFDKMIRNCPEVFEESAAAHALATLTGYFQPDETYESWLTQLSERADEWSKQLFGELLFLFYARRSTEWATNRLNEAIKDGNNIVLAGLGYGAADSWNLPHCREGATKILVACAASPDVELNKIVEPALIPEHDGRFVLDHDAKALIDVIHKNPTALRALGPQLIESIAPSVGVMPELVLSICTSYLDVVGSDISQLGSASSMTAGVLTDIALTLHRQETFREKGLQLFERLLEMGLNEAALALELLDRKPHQQPRPAPYRRPPRRRPPSSDE